MPGPRQKGGDRGTLSTPPCWPHHAGQQAQREVDQRADIEVDHVELLGTIERGGFAHQAEPGIVDEDRGLKAPRREIICQCAHTLRPRQIAGQHHRPRPAGGSDVVAIASSRASERATSTSGWPAAAKMRASFGADARGCAGHQYQRL